MATKSRPGRGRVQAEVEPEAPVVSPEAPPSGRGRRRAPGARGPFSPGYGYVHRRTLAKDYWKKTKAGGWEKKQRPGAWPRGSVREAKNAAIAQFVTTNCQGVKGAKTQIRRFLSKVEQLHLNGHDVRSLIKTLAMNDGNYGLYRSPTNRRGRKEGVPRKAALITSNPGGIVGNMTFAGNVKGRTRMQNSLLWSVLLYAGCSKLKRINDALDELALGTLGVHGDLHREIQDEPLALGTAEDDAAWNKAVADFVASHPQCARVAPGKVRNFLALVQSRSLTARDIDAVVNNLVVMGYLPRKILRPKKGSAGYADYQGLPTNPAVGEERAGLTSDARTMASRLLWNIVLKYGCEDEGLNEIFNYLNGVLETNILVNQGKIDPQALDAAYAAADQAVLDRAEEKYRASGLATYWRTHPRRLPANWKHAEGLGTQWMPAKGGGWVQRRSGKKSGAGGG